MAGPFDVDLDTLRRRTSAKWRAYDPDVLPVWVAEADVSLAPAIVEAVGAAMRRGDTGYGYGRGLADALAAFAADRWDWAIDVPATRLVADVMIGVEELVRLVTEPGAGVVVTPPVYPPFYSFVTKADRRPVEAALTPDGRLDPDTLATAFGQVAGTGAFLLCNPHNPHGTVPTRDELAMVASLASEHDVAIISDEIHAPLVLDGSFVPMTTVPGGERAIALHSASKAWNLAGLKVAVAVPGAAAVDTLAGLDEMVGHGASHIGMIAHTAAYAQGREWLDGLLAHLASNRDRLAATLAEHVPSVRYAPGAATYLAWLDFTATGLGDDPAAVLLADGRVALRGGTDFGTGGAGHARFNFATSPAILDDAVARIAAVVSARG